MISIRDRAIVQSFKRLLFERGVPVLEVIVFGSRARGDAGPDSDLDVLVVVERRDREILDLVDRCAWEAEFDPGLFIQPVTMTREEIHNGPERSSLLMLAVEQEGILV